MRKFVRWTALALIAGAALAAEEKKLNLYIWSDYLSEDVIKAFGKQTGIKVTYDTYDSNEALETKLQSGVADYDVVIPSDYMIKKLAEQGLLRKLDRDQIPNWSHQDPRFLGKSFDPSNQYSTPYFWGTTGLGYNKKSLAGPVDSWAAVFDPKNKGKILMLDDVRECFAVALKLQGQSLNCKDPAALRKAADLLKKQKALVKTYNSGDFANILAAGDVTLAHGYNGQLAEVIKEAPDELAYVVPKEGATFWCDGLCIPAKSRHPAAAHAFINFILDPKVSAQNVNEMHYACGSKGARAFIDKEILENEVIYPTDETIARCEFIQDVGDAITVYDELWTEIKSE
jgi:spermidine/putrescine-binding protein